MLVYSKFQFFLPIISNFILKVFLVVLLDGMQQNFYRHRIDYGIRPSI